MYNVVVIIDPKVAMKLNKIQANHMDLTDPIREYAWNKISELSKFLPEGTHATVDILLERTTNHHQKGDVFKAEANVEVPGQLLNAEAVHEDLYAAIDKLKDEVRRELNTYKEKLTTKRRKGQRDAKEELHSLDMTV